MHVVLAGGGTAGHVQPALALADALRRENPAIGITFLGTQRGLETRLVPARGYDLSLIPAVPLPRSLTPRLLAVPGRILGAVRSTAGVLDRVGADVVVGFGGYVAAPAYVAARMRHVPIVVHEANPYPGLANRLGARLTDRVATAHPQTALPHAAHVGIPLRRSIVDMDRTAGGRQVARAHFGLRPELPTLLVVGGSQGARSLNQAAAGAARHIRAAGVQVLHLTGASNLVEVEEEPGGPPYVTAAYVDSMELAYAAADFALCRAGALTCAELTAVGLPACYVPFPFGNGEQVLNARPVVDAGGGLLVADQDVCAQWIRDTLLPHFADAGRRTRMSESAARLGHREADVALARLALGARGGAGRRRGRHGRQAVARRAPTGREVTETSAPPTEEPP